MSNQPSSRNYLQAEAVDFRSPVSESMLKTFAGTQNWLLDKDTANDGTIAAIQAAAGVLTGRVNNAASFSSATNTVVYDYDPNPRTHTVTLTARQVAIVTLRVYKLEPVSSGFSIGGTNFFEISNYDVLEFHNSSPPIVWRRSYVITQSGSLSATFYPRMDISTAILTFNLV